MHYHKTYDTSDLNVLNVDEYFVITIKKSFCNEVIVIMLLFVEIKGKNMRTHEICPEFHQ